MFCWFEPCQPSLGTVGACHVRYYVLPCRATMLCRLEGLVLQEATAKAAAVNHASQLRKQADDLQDRLNAAVAAEHAARHELSVHKQQVRSDDIRVLLPGMDLFSICNWFSPFTGPCVAQKTLVETACLAFCACWH